MKVSFSGIYDLRFPIGTSNESIKKKYKHVQEVVKDMDLGDFVYTKELDYFDVTKIEKPVEKPGIRLYTPALSPSIMFDLFENIEKGLGSKYVDQTKVELVLNA